MSTTRTLPGTARRSSWMVTAVPDRPAPMMAMRAGGVLARAVSRAAVSTTTAAAIDVPCRSARISRMPAV
jgi:hypothetical protein